MRYERLRDLEAEDPLMEKVQTSEYEGSDFLRKLQEDDEYEDDLNVQKKKKEEEEDPDFKISLRDPQTIEEEILFFFQVCTLTCLVQFFHCPQEVIRDMKLVLERRSELEKKSAKGKQDTTLHLQTKVFLRPFFQKLASGVCWASNLLEFSRLY